MDMNFNIGGVLLARACFLAYWLGGSVVGYTSAFMVAAAGAIPVSPTCPFFGQAVLSKESATYTSGQPSFTARFDSTVYVFRFLAACEQRWSCGRTHFPDPDQSNPDSR